MREVVLAERDQHAVVAAGEVEALGDRFVLLHPRLERSGRTVLDEVGQVLHEFRGAAAAGVVPLRQRENLLELVEDEQRHHGLAAGVMQDVPAVVEEFP